MPEEMNHSYLWDEIWGATIIQTIDQRDGCVHSALSLSLFLLVFQKLLQSLRLAQENAQPPLQPLRALGLEGGDLGRLGPSFVSAEETRGAGFLWGLGPRRPAHRRVRPRQLRARRWGRRGGTPWGELDPRAGLHLRLTRSAPVHTEAPRA